MAISFRALTADDVECRVAQLIDGSGCQLLIYKNARTDMSILDETVGAENWQRDHYECKGNLFCRVSIRVGDIWVTKSDCGAESNTEAEKGEASDSFKRACTNWGIGRELYTTPFIWINASDFAIKSKSNGKKEVKDKFEVTFLAVENGSIVGLEITNKNSKKIVFSHGKANKNRNTNSTPDSQGNGAKKKDPPSDTKQQAQTLTAADALKFIMTYGPHKGDTLGTIWNTDPGYIKELHDDPTTDPAIVTMLELIKAAAMEARKKAEKNFPPDED